MIFAKFPWLAAAVVAATLMAGALSPGLLAQSTESGSTPVVVSVSDSTGAAVADAVVEVARGAERHTVTTRRDGIARFGQLSAGRWEMTVSREGFSRWTSTLDATSGLTVPIRLDVAGFSESVQVESVSGQSTQIPLNAPAAGGSRLDIPVRELPASLFLVGQALIQDRGARSVEEAVQLAAGMQASTGVGSIPSYATRGWSGNDISVMRDGIRQNSASQSSRPVDAFLLERIEVLKGPASLLYGEGALAGAINLVSKSPFSQLNVDSLLAYGSFGQYRAGVGINAPLRRNLFARVDLSQSGSDGYVRDSPQKLIAAAASVRWLPTNNINIKTTGTYSYDDTSPQYYATPFIDGRIDPRTRDINYNMADALAKSHNRWLQVEGEALLGRGWMVHNQFFVATHTLDWRNFEGYTYNAATRTVDVSSFFLIYRHDLLVGNRGTVKRTFRLKGRDVGFVAGAEAQRNDLERAGNPTPNFPLPVRKLDPFNPVPHVDPGFSYVRQRDVLINTAATFAESVASLTPRLKVVSGFRWERIGLGYTPYPSLVTAKQDYQPLTGRVGGVFEVTPEVNVYASFSRAVQPTTQLVSLDGSQQRFSLVPGRQFEVGSKGASFGGRLEATFAYFAIAKRDLLITQLIDGIQTAQQIGEQTSNGIELALVARPTRSLTISGDVAYTGAEFTDFVEIVGGVNTDRSGNTPPNIPRTIWNVSPMQRIGPIDLTGTLRHVGSRWGDNGNTREVDGFTAIDLGVSYRLRRGARIMLRGRNLTDRIYTQSVSNTAGRLEPGRSIDVTFTANLTR